MHRNTKRRLCVILTLTLIAAAACALAEVWICPECGQTGNTGKFCPNCAAPAPAEGWTCENCGQSGNTGNFCTNCASPKPGASAPRAVVNERLEQIPGESDRVKVRTQKAEASSYIVNKQDPGRWVPGNAVDGNESTCWQFSAKKGLKGKTWISLITGSAQTVDEIWFKNGFWAYNDKGKEQYSINARPKAVRVEFQYEGTNGFRDAAELTLRDQSFNGWQKFALGRHERVTAVRIAILSIYKGSHFENDVCLSEAMLVQNAPAATARAAGAAASTAVYESRPDVTGVGLLMKLATRSGPGTKYDEPGTFFGNNWKETTVRVLGKHWDGSIWWVLVDFGGGGKAYRVWTGLKRVDVDINKVKEVYAIGQGTVSATSETYRGPGKKYAKAKVDITKWRDVEAYGRENGFVEVEFQQGKKWYRVWVPEGVTSIDWGNDFYGEN